MDKTYPREIKGMVEEYVLRGYLKYVVGVNEHGEVARMLEAEKEQVRAARGEGEAGDYAHSLELNAFMLLHGQTSTLLRQFAVDLTARNVLSRVLYGETSTGRLVRDDVRDFLARERPMRYQLDRIVRPYFPGTTKRKPENFDPREVDDKHPETPEELSLFLMRRVSWMTPGVRWALHTAVAAVVSGVVQMAMTPLDKIKVWCIVDGVLPERHVHNVPWALSNANLVVDMPLAFASAAFTELLRAGLYLLDGRLALLLTGRAHAWASLGADAFDFMPAALEPDPRRAETTPFVPNPRISELEYLNFSTVRTLRRQLVNFATAVAVLPFQNLIVYSHYAGAKFCTRPALSWRAVFSWQGSLFNGLAPVVLQFGMNLFLSLVSYAFERFTLYMSSLSEEYELQLKAERESQQN